MTRYCPNGDGAFDDWVGSCPECGSALVDTPPDPDDVELAATDVSLVQLMTVSNEIEANLVAGILRDAGIPVMARPGGPGVGAWWSTATFEHAIYVREGDQDRARTILDETRIDDDDSIAPEES